MKPLIYGYMRVSQDTPDHGITRLEAALRTFAEAEGYCFAKVFHEYDGGRYGAFDELVEELKRAEAHHVVMPSTDDLAAHPFCGSPSSPTLSGQRTPMSTLWDDGEVPPC